MLDAPVFEPERRPALIELAAALLIVGGFMQLLLVAVSAAQGFAMPDVLTAITLAVNIIAIATGLLIRAGRRWLVCVNVVVVLGFLNFLAVAQGSLAAALFLLVDGVAIVAVVRHKDWFDRPRSAEEAERRAREAASAEADGGPG